MRDEYIIVSKKYRRPLSENNMYILFWRPNSRGYTYSLDSAGLYCREYLDKEGIKNNEDMIVVDATKLQKIAIGAPADADNSMPYLAVLNSAANWATIETMSKEI